MNDDLDRLECAARKSVEEQYGRALSDEEWAAAKQALIDLARLLRDWHRPKDQDQ